MSNFKSFKQDSGYPQVQHHELTLIKNDIRDTLEKEASRFGGTEACSAFSYCSSCPVANAVWRLVADNSEVYEVDVGGSTIAVYLTNAPESEREIFNQAHLWWHQSAVVPIQISDWIVAFDTWLGHGNIETLEKTRQRDVQRLLNNPDEWPELPEPFEVKFERLES